MRKRGWREGEGGRGESKARSGGVLKGRKSLSSSERGD